MKMIVRGLWAALLLAVSFASIRISGGEITTDLAWLDESKPDLQV